VLAGRGKGITIYHVAVPFAAAALIIALTRSGAGFNHSLDLMILSAVLTAGLWMRLTKEHLSRAALVPIAVTLAMIASYPILVETSEEVSPARLRGDIGFLDRLVGPGDRILAEDASIPIALDQVPVVLDSFMLPTIGARDPEALEALVERLEHHAFDRVILFYPLNDAPEGWYTMQFGTSVADAIARNYTLVGGGNRSYVYVPRAP
jgi:hypothetical protein